MSKTFVAMRILHVKVHGYTRVLVPATYIFVLNDNQWFRLVVPNFVYFIFLCVIVFTESITTCSGPNTSILTVDIVLSCYTISGH